MNCIADALTLARGVPSWPTDPIPDWRKRTEPRLSAAADDKLAALQFQHALGLQSAQLSAEVHTLSLGEKKQNERSRGRDGKATHDSLSGSSAAGISWPC